MWLDPRPTPDSIRRAHSTYCTHETPVSSPVKGLRKLVRSLANGYRNYRFGSNFKPANEFGRLIQWLPSLRKTLDQEFRHIPKACAGSRLLDIGAGNGEFLTFASAIGWEVIGVEPDAAAADLARSRGLEMHTDTLDTLPVDQGPFDQVTLMQVVEHVHDPFSLLCHIRARLKPGGRLWLETSNAGSLILHAYGSDWRGLELHDTYSSQPGLPRKTCSFQRAM